jgi:hypothetical protein
MDCVSFASRNWLAALALTLTAASFGATGTAQAADFYDPPEIRRPPVTQYEPRVEYGERYARPRYAPPVVAEGPDACRVIHKRHVDPYGREVVRRVRICEDEGAPPPPRWAYRTPPRYGYGYGSGYEPGPYDAPRPPRAVGSPYDDDDLD